MVECRVRHVLLCLSSLLSVRDCEFVHVHIQLSFTASQRSIKFLMSCVHVGCDPQTADAFLFLGERGLTQRSKVNVTNIILFTLVFN